MSVRFIGPHQNMGPVPIDAATAVQRGDVVRVVSGLVVPIVINTVANMAAVMETNPDPEREEPGGKTQVDLARLGEDTEVEMPFVAPVGGITAAMIGGTFAITASGNIDVAVTATPSFKVLRLSRDTAFTNLTGFVQGVFLDSASL